MAAFSRIAKRMTPAVCFTSFVLLLTFFIYSRPPLYRYSYLGWQEYESIDRMPAEGTAQDVSHLSDHVDWWDNASESPETSSSSFPLNLWNPLSPHETGLTEISVQSCWLSPALVSYCSPSSTPDDDAIKGPWVRVDRDVNLKTGNKYLHLWYRRSRRFDVPLITQVMILADDEIDLLPNPKSSWHKARGSLTDGNRSQSKDVYMWYKLRPPLVNVTDEEEIQDVITEVDVLYGDGVPFYGFERLTPSITPSDEKNDAVSIVYRRGVKVPPKSKPLHFWHDGTFKIMQIADLHYSVSRGACRDTLHIPCTASDAETTSMLSYALDEEKPDLVVFTGDQLNGQGTSWDAKSVIAKFAEAVISRNISWAAVFGNHDSEQTDLSREQEMQLYSNLPFSLAQSGPAEVHGIGNYVLKVYSPDPSKMHLLTLYFLDSGDYADKGWQWWKPKDYDYIHEDQRDWFLKESDMIMPIERPFSPDGAKDFGDVFGDNIDRKDDSRSGAKGVVQKRATALAKPNALVFFHIPLQEAYDPADADPEHDPSRTDVGDQYEGSGASGHNAGFFEDALLRARESSAFDAKPEVKVIANGHCHITDRCRRVSGIYNCFGGGGSFSGYGRIGFDRRFRIYHVKDFGETIETYKRTEGGDILDRQTLVGLGAPP